MTETPLELLNLHADPSIREIIEYFDSIGRLVRQVCRSEDCGWELEVQEKYLIRAMLNRDTSWVAEHLTVRQVDRPLRFSKPQPRTMEVFDLFVWVQAQYGPRGEYKEDFGDAFTIQVGQLLLDLGYRFPAERVFRYAVYRRAKALTDLLGGVMLLAPKHLGHVHTNLSQQSLGELLCDAILQEDSCKIADLLQLKPDITATLIEGKSPLAQAVDLGKEASIVLLLLYDSRCNGPEKANAALYRATECGNWRIVDVILLVVGQFPLDSSRSWPLLESLAKRNFAAPGDIIDKLIGCVGILNGLRLSITHRHERLMTHMLWQLTRGPKKDRNMTEVDEVLEGARQAGVEQGYVQHVRQAIGGVETQPPSWPAGGRLGNFRRVPETGNGGGRLRIPQGLVVLERRKQVDLNPSDAKSTKK